MLKTSTNPPASTRPKRRLFASNSQQWRLRIMAQSLVAMVLLLFLVGIKSQLNYFSYASNETLKVTPAAASPMAVKLFSSQLTTITNTTRQQCPELSRELFEQVAVNNTIILSIVNAFQKDDFLRNWLLTANDAGINYYVIGAIDEETSYYLPSIGVPCFKSFVETVDGVFGIGTKNWERISWQRVFLLNKVVPWGFRILLTDLDVVWFRDPLEVLPDKTYADILFSKDVPWSNPPNADPLNANDKFPLDRGGMHTPFNAGFYVIYPTNGSIAAIRAWNNYYYEVEKDLNDQNGLYKALVHGNDVPHPNDERISSALNETVWLGVVPIYTFATAHSYSVSQLHNLYNTQPVAMHAVSLTYGGAIGKISRLREAMMWYDAPEYYSLGDYVTVDLKDLPPMPADFNTRTDTDTLIEFHLKALQVQLEQIYIGMTLAVASNRTFIFPKIVSFCDRNWHSLDNCRMPGAWNMKFPIVSTPQDYYFYLDRFADEPAVFGPPLRYREFSFLDNKRTSIDIKTSTITIQPDTTLNTDACVAALGQSPSSVPTACGQTTTDSNILKVAPRLSDKELIKILKPYENKRVWRLSFKGLDDIWDAFSGFECPRDAAQLDKRMSRLNQDWCCRKPDEAKAANKPERVLVTMLTNGIASWKRQVFRDDAC